MSLPLLRFACCWLFVVSLGAGEAIGDGRVRVLIIDGRNNHDWRATTDALRATLEHSGRFNVRVTTAPEYLGPPTLREPKTGDAGFAEAKARSEALAKPSQLALQLAWERWRPDFTQVDAVVLNYNGPAWPAAMRQDFTDYVKRGGGVLLIHAANNAFSDWPEFNAMIGLGWRKAGFGTCLAVNPTTGVGTPCCADSATAHGSRHPFVVTNHRREHPVLQGLPTTWMHGKDELYHHQRGPAENLTILASAFSDPQQRGSNQHEPVLWEVTYGKGRTLVCSLGHQWNGQEDRDGLYCVGFQTLVARGTEYIATGAVTLDVPADFPTKEKPVIAAPHTITWRRGGQPALISAAPIDWQKKKAEREAAVLTPEEEAASFVLAPGFVPELVAAEPLVQEPVLAVWDGNGALYVAEMRSYMQDEKGTGTKTLKNGRIKRLVDNDGDGRMDQATVFADGLNLPRMILPLDDRIAVVETDSSSVWSFRDTNGDGVAEEKTLLYQGKAGDPNKSVEHQDSGLDWNLDNWISISYGRERYRFTDGTWRAQPMHGIWAQWGVTHDDVGRTFFSTNTDPALGFQMPRVYWSLIEKRSGAKPPPNDPISLGLPWEMSFLEAKNLCKRDDRGGDAPARKVFTSACGQSIFRGSALPPEHRGDYFVCDPTIHVVRQANVSNRNGRIWFDSTYGKDEFLVSPDILFRPVNTASGPDGCVTVVDMYRGIIQDAPWLSEGPREFIKKSGLAEVNQRGRIWRIRHRDHAPLSPPRMLDETTPQLLRHLAHSDGWWRDTAQRLIILRADRDSVAPALADLVRFHADPLCRLHALWTLEGIGALTAELVQRAWQDGDPRVRAAGIRVAEPWFSRDDAAFLTAAQRHADQERDPEVARQLIQSLGFSSSPSIIPLIDQLTERHLSHEGVFLATTTVLWKKPSPFIARIQSGEAFTAITNVEQRAQAIAMWTQGLGQWNRGLTLPASMPKEQRDLISKGETLFYQNCVSCHGTDGRGVKVPGSELAIAPPLAGSARVRGPAEKLVPVLLNGLMGPIDGVTYQGAFMPPAAAIGITRDDRLAEITSFVRYAWGNEASPVTADQVKELRKRHANRQAPWTDAELKSLDGGK